MSAVLEKMRPRDSLGTEDFRVEYLQALRLIERLHRLLLDVIKDEFDREGGADLNSVQALNSRRAAITSDRTSHTT